MSPRRRRCFRAACLPALAAAAGCAAPVDPFENAPPPALFARDSEINPFDFRDPPAAWRPIADGWLPADGGETALRARAAALKAAGFGALLLRPPPAVEIPIGEVLSPESPADRSAAFTGAALAAARDAGLKVWLSIDGRWPAGADTEAVPGGGTDGGGTRSLPGPDAAARVLACAARRVAGPAPFSTGVPEGEPVLAAAARLDGERIVSGSLRPLNGFVRGGTLAWEAPEGTWEVYLLTARPADGGSGRLTAGRPVDPFDAEAVSAYLAAVIDDPARRHPEAFAAAVAGVVAEVPAPFLADGTDDVPWTRDLIEDFARKQGYDLRPLLPLLWREGDGAARVRSDFRKHLHDRYTGAWVKALRERCAPGRLALAGVLPAGALRLHEPVRGADPFRLLGGFDRPGVRPIGDWDGAGLPLKLAGSIAHGGGGASVLHVAAPGGMAAPGGTRHATDRGAVRGATARLLPAPADGEAAPLQALRAARIAWLLGGDRHAAGVGVLYASTVLDAAAAGDPGPAERMERDLAMAADALLETQIDFDFVDSRALGAVSSGGGAAPSDGVLRIGEGAYRALILPADAALDAAALDVLRAFVEGGGTLIATGALPVVATAGDAAEARARVEALFGVGTGAGPAAAAPRRLGQGTVLFLPPPAAPALAAAVAAAVPRDVTLSRPIPALKAVHRRRAGAEVYFLVNESDEPADVDASFPFPGPATQWDPDTGTVRLAPVQRSEAGFTSVHLALPPRGATFLVFAPADRGVAAVADRLPLARVAPPGFAARFRREGGALAAEVDATQAGEFRIEAVLRRQAWGKTFRIPEVPPPIPLDGPWSFQREAPGAPVEKHPASAWTDRHPDFAGRARYARKINVSGDWLMQGMGLRLDLGEVRDVAEVHVNGVRVAELSWPPYAADLAPHLQAGENEIAVTVAGAGPGPRGLLGPVRIVVTKPYRIVLSPLEE